MAIVCAVEDYSLKHRSIQSNGKDRMRTKSLIVIDYILSLELNVSHDMWYACHEEQSVNPWKPAQRTFAISKEQNNKLSHMLSICKNKTIEHIPVGPLAPVSPGVPCWPRWPGVPVAPTCPWIPTWPALPILPFSPEAPVKPCKPGAPSGPATPVAPVGPVTPEKPVAPRKQQR